ncbi:hypothetical protein AAVH_07059 [Aphelenchoides avenae]|nr:hypothetical protein AAVH_07059 [Aphelenchus avenae]
MPTSVSVLQQPPQSTAQQQSLPSATQQQSLPSTTQQHPSPSTTQQHSLPSTAQQHSLPSTAQQHSLPSATQQHSLPSATQQQPLPSTTQQQSLPSTTQQHPSQSTTQQQPQFASLQMAMQPNAPLQLASATNASETPSASSHSQGASGTSTAEARAGDNPLPQITDSETTGEHHATDEHGVKKLQFEPVPVTYRDRYKNSFDIESNNSATPGLIYSFQLVDGDPATVGYFVCGRCSALDKKHAIPTVKVAFNKLVTDPDNPLNRRCKGSAVHFCCATSTQSPHSRLARGTNATKSYSTRKSSARLAKASADGSTQASEHEKAAPALPTSPLMVPVEKRHDSSAKASPESKKRGRVRPAKKSDSDSSEDDFLDCGKKKRPVKKERTGSEDVYEIDEQSEGAVEPSNATGDESGTVARSPDVVHSKPPFHYGKATFVDARKKSFLTNSRLYPNAQFTFEDTESEFSSGGRLYRRYRCQDCSAILEGEAVKGDMPDMLVTDGYVVSNPDMPSGQPHICIENNQSDA